MQDYNATHYKKTATCKSELNAPKCNFVTVYSLYNPLCFPAVFNTCCLSWKTPSEDFYKPLVLKVPTKKNINLIYSRQPQKSLSPSLCKSCRWNAVLYAGGRKVHHKSSRLNTTYLS